MDQVDTVKGSGNLRQAVKLPEGEDLNEWLAVHGESGWPACVASKERQAFQPSISLTTSTCSMAQ